MGNNNKVQLTDVFNDVTLLFADIAGFTKYSSGVKPQDVVKMLKYLFTEFDKMCVKHKVYKVYTIGDCYVVMGFLQAKDRNPVLEAKNVVQMGLSMIEIIRNVRTLINFDDLDMRIGIHTVIFNLFSNLFQGFCRGTSLEESSELILSDMIFMEKMC